jgi:hypothetical protein
MKRDLNHGSIILDSRWNQLKDFKVKNCSNVAAQLVLQSNQFCPIHRLAMLGFTIVLPTLRCRIFNALHESSIKPFEFPRQVPDCFAKVSFAGGLGARPQGSETNWQSINLGAFMLGQSLRLQCLTLKSE